MRARVTHQLPESQRNHRASHRQIDTPSSVAILLSHVRVWQWLAERPHIPCALVVEDDVCFDEDFAAKWSSLVAPLVADATAWDCIMVGYFRENVAEARDTRILAGIPLRTLRQFFGTHAYLVTQRGAAILHQYALPIDHQADGLIITLSDLDLLRLYALPRSVATQCLDAEDKEGAWHTHATTAETTTTTTTTLFATTATGKGGPNTEDLSVGRNVRFWPLVLAALTGFLLGMVIAVRGRRLSTAPPANPSR